MIRKPVLDALDAEVAARAVLDHARSAGLKICVAIVDDGGVPLQLSRMDGASAAAVDGAIGKASSAALTGADTKLLEQMVNDRPALSTMRRVAVEGGVAILLEGERLGGIGVSGGPSHLDAESARAGLEALMAHWTK